MDHFMTTALSSPESLIDSLVAALHEAVVVVSAECRVIAVNAAAVRLAPTLRRQDLLVRSLRAPDVLDAVADVIKTGQARSTLWLDRFPVERQFDVHLAPFLFEGQRACVITLHDMTESRRLERMRADFVANASHELRTPLASILGFIETLQGPARDDARARENFLGIMREQARRMARLVDDLLSLSRIEQNLHLPPETPVDLVSVASHIVDSLHAVAEDAGVEVQIIAPKPVSVLGDRDELLRVAENLIENAIKYAAPSKVCVHVESFGKMARFSVSDEGPGIAPDHLPRLTERFYRVDARQSRAKGGTGLGLAIVKHIVARHRGRLTVDSVLGQGTTFTVLLPKLDDTQL